MDELQQLALENKQNSEDRLATALAQSLLASSPIVDRLSSWVLGAAGATGVVLTSSLSELVTLLPVEDIRLSSTALLLSALFGFWAKVRAVEIELYTSGAKVALENADSIFERHDEFADQIEEIAKRRGVHVTVEVDELVVREKLLLHYPAWCRWAIRRSLSVSPVAALSNCVSSWCLQAVLTTVQIVAFLAFFFAVFVLGLLP